MHSHFKEDLEEGKGLERMVARYYKVKHNILCTLSEGKFKEFDIDLPAIKSSIECKFDKKSKETKNSAWEFACFGKPSGISTTKATHWLHQLWHDGQWKFLLGRVDEIRKFLDSKKNKREVRGGDGNLSQMWLINKDELLETGIFRIKTKKELIAD